VYDEEVGFKKKIPPGTKFERLPVNQYIVTLLIIIIYTINFRYLCALFVEQLKTNSVN
jgi:hypothetical protein